MSVPHRILPAPSWVQELATNPFGQALLAGRLVATAVSPADGKHITIRFSAKAPSEGGGRWQATTLLDAKRVYVDVPGRDLRAGDNVGNLDVRSGTFWASNDDTRRVNAARYLLLVALGRLPGDKVQLATHCLRCGRPLTDPVSIARNIGPECFGKVTGSVHEAKGDALPSPADPAPTQEWQDPHTQAVEDWKAHKAAFAQQEAEQERAAFASDPDQQQFITVNPSQEARA